MNAVAQAVHAVVRQWSPYQNDVFAFGADPHAGNAIVIAVAGSGKTTTLVELVRRMGGNSISLAFNKKIADEQVARGINARTFHSLCAGALRNFLGGKLNADKTRDILFTAVANAQLTQADATMYGAFVKRLVGLAKNAGIGCLVQDTEENWASIVDYHDLEIDDEKGEIARGIAIARIVLAVGNESEDYDFDDMLYLVVKHGVRLPVFDMVCIDEAQDTNAIQRAILRKIMRGGSRLIAFGDPCQAIYGFRGADSSAMDLLADEFDCRRLPLTVSYRCPRRVVEHARQWVDHIESAPSAIEGSVTTLDTWTPATFAVGDMVVCRTTAPLIGVAYALLRAKVAVRVLGKEIGQGLTALVKKMNTTGLDRLAEKLEAYSKREVERAVARGNDAKAAAVADKVESILCLMEALVGDEKTVPDLIRLIDSLFNDREHAVQLSTIHKAKGLEAKRVFWLDAHKCLSKWARKEHQLRQEHNICYVAATRAQEALIMIDSESRGY
jgi:superfamily I DNA/RNA helicase